MAMHKNVRPQSRENVTKHKVMFGGGTSVEELSPADRRAEGRQNLRKRH